MFLLSGHNCVCSCQHRFLHDSHPCWGSRLRGCRCGEPWWPWSWGWFWFGDEGDDDDGNGVNINEQKLCWIIGDFDRFPPPDLWRATVRLHGIHHTSVCRHVLLRGSQWHSSHLIKVMIMSGMMIAFVVLSCFFLAASQGSLPQALLCGCSAGSDAWDTLHDSGLCLHTTPFNLSYSIPADEYFNPGGQVNTCTCCSHRGEIVVFYLFLQIILVSIIFKLTIVPSTMWSSQYTY